MTYYILNRTRKISGRRVGLPASAGTGRGFRDVRAAAASIAGSPHLAIIDATAGRQVDRNGRIVESDTARYTLNTKGTRTITWIAEAQDIHPAERALGSYEEHVERLAVAQQIVDQAEYQLGRTTPCTPEYEMAERRLRAARAAHQTAGRLAREFCTAQLVAASQLNRDVEARILGN